MTGGRPAGGARRALALLSVLLPTVPLPTVPLPTVLLLTGLLSMALAAVSVAAPSPPGIAVGGPLQEPGERPVLGAPASWAESPAATHPLRPGQRLLAGPDPFAAERIRIPESGAADLQATVLGERSRPDGIWLRVRWGDVTGWVFDADGSRVHDGGAAIGADPRRLARRDEVARQARLAVPAGRGAEVTVATAAGPVDLRIHADLPADRRSLLVELVGCLPSLHAERFGPLPEPPPRPIDVVVFPDAVRYRDFAHRRTSLHADTGGFELDGVVVLHGGAPLVIDFLGLAAHELTHALNRLYFVDAAPRAWVEEGMAEDLAHAVEAAHTRGRPLCSEPGGWSRAEVVRMERVEDGDTVVDSLVTHSARALGVICFPGPSGADPRGLDRLDFLLAEDRPRLYLESMILLRALLESGVEDLRSDPVLEGEREVIVQGRLAALPWLILERGTVGCGSLR